MPPPRSDPEAERGQGVSRDRVLEHGAKAPHRGASEPRPGHDVSGVDNAERWRTPIRSSDKGLSPCTAPHTVPKNAVDRELFDHPMAYRGGHGDRGRLSLVKLGLSRLVGGSVGVYAHHRTDAAPDGLSPLETANARWNFDVLGFNEA
jgi:hypothetical protein